jgi:competence transcription factor ComK
MAVQLQIVKKKLSEKIKNIFQVKKIQKFVFFSTEFAGSTQNTKIIIGILNQPTRMKIFPKKPMFSTLKVFLNGNYPNLEHYLRERSSKV